MVIESYRTRAYTMSEKSLLACMFQRWKKLVEEEFLFLDRLTYVSETCTPAMLGLQMKVFGRHRHPRLGGIAAGNRWSITITLQGGRSCDTRELKRSDVGQSSSHGSHMLEICCSCRSVVKYLGIKKMTSIINRP